MTSTLRCLKMTSIWQRWNIHWLNNKYEFRISKRRNNVNKTRNSQKLWAWYLRVDKRLQEQGKKPREEEINESDRGLETWYEWVSLELKRKGGDAVLDDPKKHKKRNYLEMLKNMKKDKRVQSNSPFKKKNMKRPGKNKRQQLRAKRFNKRWSFKLPESMKLLVLKLFYLFRQSLLFSFQIHVSLVIEISSSVELNPSWICQALVHFLIACLFWVS